MLVSFDDSIAFTRYRTVFKEPLQIPNIDRILQHSASFEAAYCQSPICGPSRVSFMSGLSPHQTGVLDNYTEVFDHVPPQEMWSYRLKENGYFCSSGGKVHHKYRPVQRSVHYVLYSDHQKRFGNDMSLPVEAETRSYGGHRGGKATTQPEFDDTYYDARSANSAIEFLNSYDGDAPFYREVGFFSPHGPHYTPARFKDLYNVHNFEPPAAWADGFDEHPYSDELFPQNEELKKGNLTWWKQSVRNYFSALSHGDYHLGRVWDALQASPHAKNTIVIILSDHGFNLGNRNRYMKKALWEQVAQVPLIIHDPDDPTPKEIYSPVGLIDVGPTVLDYAGLPQMEGRPGQSLRPYMNGVVDRGRSIPTFHFSNVAIRRGNFRMIRYDDGSVQLFNVRKDFWNLRPIDSSSERFEPILRELFACAAAYGLSLDTETPSDGDAKGPVATPMTEKRIEMTKKPLGVVTMAYEDYFFLDRWYRYYAEQVGPENTFVFSHGGDPEHRRIAEGANVINVPREQNLYNFDLRRWRMMSLFVSGMLEFYSWMILTDVDEIVVADPAKAPSLIDHLISAHGDLGMAPASISPFALNMIHVPEEEPEPIEEGATILSRRRRFMPSRVYSKPCLVRQPVVFGPGGHRNTLGRRHLSDTLYLVHLKYFDEPMLRERAASRKEMIETARELNKKIDGDHQWGSTYQQYEDLLKNNPLGPEDIDLPEFRAAMMQQVERHKDQFIWGPAKQAGLFRIPERFVSLF